MWVRIPNKEHEHLGSMASILSLPAVLLLYQQLTSIHKVKSHRNPATFWADSKNWYILFLH